MFDAPLDAVTMRDEEITAVSAGGRDHGAGVFVDASYEGDLLAAAGVAHQVGREDRGRYRERFAGRREPAPGKHNFPPLVSPFDRPGVLSPLIHDAPSVEVGAGDGGVMAYGYRVCLSSERDRLPFPHRPGYDPDEWGLARRWFTAAAAHGMQLDAHDVLGLVGPCRPSTSACFSRSWSRTAPCCRWAERRGSGGVRVPGALPQHPRLPVRLLAERPSPLPHHHRPGDRRTHSRPGASTPAAAT